jgi:universal stress protein E
MEDNDMQTFKDILYVATPASTDHAAIERAVKLAENNQARLTVVEVIDQMPRLTKLIDKIQLLEDFQAKSLGKHQQRLEKLVAPWDNNKKIQTKVLIGIPFVEIIREILRHGHDLVIKTAESGGLMDRVFGSNDMYLLRECPCPVWLVKSESPAAIHQILAAVDIDEYYPPEELNTRHQLNLQILEKATSLALTEFSKLHVVHVWEAIAENTLRGAFLDMSEDKIIAYIEGVQQQHTKNMSILMDKSANKLGQEALEYLKPRTRLLKGHPRKVIPVFAKEIEADLVVMGTVARTGISGFFMGNTAETILNQLDCSVLAVKPPGFKTPVTL